MFQENVRRLVDLNKSGQKLNGMIGLNYQLLDKLYAHNKACQSGYSRAHKFPALCFYFSSFTGNTMEAKIESTNTLPTTASDSDDEM